MKKALLFIGLAVCTSFAFAQTNNYAKSEKIDFGKSKTVTVSLNADANLPVDYKASIFTKADGDTIITWNFNSNPAQAGFVFGEAGRVTTPIVVNGDTLNANAQTNPSATWQWVEGDDFFTSTFFQTNYTDASYANYITRYLQNYMDDGGYMLMSMRVVHGSGLPHAYMTFPSVAVPANTTIVDVDFDQLYRKFYDQCYIDYKINGNWQYMAVNVDGVDADINSFSSLHRTYTMPVALVQEANIELRFRHYGSVRSNAYGYIWAVDNVSIIEGGLNRWKRWNQEFVDGAYGTMPQNMNIPLTWVSNLSNNGVNDRANVKVNADHLSPAGTVTNLFSVNQDDMEAGDAMVQYPVVVNERGLLGPGDVEDGYVGWYSNEQSTYAQPSITGYGMHGLPTAETGRNVIQLNATSPNADTLFWPAIPYRVVPFTTSAQQPVSGYRWGHDNGIIATGSSYTYGYEFVQNNWYLSDTGAYRTAGYWLTVRYVTGNDIPVDDNNDPWVFKGVEIVTSPDISPNDLNGAVVGAIMMSETYPDRDHVNFNTINTGVEGAFYRQVGTDISNYQPTGGYSFATGENYNAVNIFFPEQPEMEPNTSYRIGYQLGAASNFAAAETRWSYSTSGDNYISYDSVPELAQYYNQFTTSTYDIYLYDPGYEGRMWAGAYKDEYPLIRAIVGPRQEVARHNIYVTLACSDTNQVQIEYNDMSYCGEQASVAEGSSPTFYIIPGGVLANGDVDFYVIDSIIIDGTLTLTEEDAATDDNPDGNEWLTTNHDYNVRDTINGQALVLLYRNYWSYVFDNVMEDHTITAFAHREELGIDPVAGNVSMLLAPNPATSQVKLALNGVTGTVNCSIIDMSGRVVYSSNINAEASHMIDLSGVPAGAYFVRVTNDTFSKVEKLIIR